MYIYTYEAIDRASRPKQLPEAAPAPASPAHKAWAPRRIRLVVQIRWLVSVGLIYRPFPVSEGTTGRPEGDSAAPIHSRTA